MRTIAIACAVGALLLAGCQREAAPPAADSPAPVAEPAAGQAEAEAEPGHAFSSQIAAEDFAAHVRTLASDEFEGRAPGTAGERKTTAYLVEQLERLGARPGNGDSWFQSVPMVEVTSALDGAMTITFENGSEQAFTPGEDLVLGSRRTVEQVGIDGSDLVFVGYGINAPEQEWNDYAGLDVTGKTVVMLINDPGFATQDENLFRGNAMTYYGRWTYKYEEAARQGAAGALIVHETRAASYGWDVVYNSWSGPQFDLPAGTDAEPLLAVQGWISGPAAERIFSAAGQDLQALVEAAKQRGFQSVALPAKASATVNNRVREATSNNVIGLIEGSERPDEYVLYTAHWDHLGRSFSAPGGDGIFNGAIDNASGVAGVLEIGAAFAAQRPAPKRSVVLLFVTLEESGLLGSRYYAENPVFPLAQTAAAINLDAMSVIGPSRDIVVVGYGNSNLDDHLRTTATAQGRVVVPEPTPENGFYFRSDHFNFAKAGVPALYAKGGQDHVEHGVEFGQAQAAEYNRLRYHKPADEYDPDWDLRGVVQDLEALYAVGRSIADEDSWPQWSPSSEFRAAGDALAARRSN